MREQNQAFVGDHREERVKEESYRCIVVLPFGEKQIRSYLSKRLGEARAEGAMHFIRTIHSLSDLAPRPFFLKLIHEHFGRLEKKLADGETVQGVTLYQLMVEGCLLRDKGKHRILEEDKKRLMEDIAWSLWQDNNREWPWEKVFSWLRTQLYSDPVMAATYQGDPTKSFEVLSSDFRTATLLLRPPDSEKEFRFAHRSIQEYFLAASLVRALKENRKSQWQIPMVSDETLDFMGQLLTQSPEKEWKPTLNLLLQQHQPQASLLAAKYWTVAAAKDYPLPTPSRLDLPGENLAYWKFHGKPERPFYLPEANFSQAGLLHVEFQNVYCQNLNIEGARALGILFNQATIQEGHFTETDLTGSYWRDVDLQQARGTPWSHEQTRVVRSPKVATLLPPSPPPPTRPSEPPPHHPMAS